MDAKVGCDYRFLQVSDGKIWFVKVRLTNEDRRCILTACLRVTKTLIEVRFFVGY